MNNKFDIPCTRPFNAEHARAGAPFCTSHGDAVEMLKWDRAYQDRDGTTYPLLGLVGPDQDVIAWSANGTCSLSRDRLVMLPLGLVQGKPFFVGDTIVGAIAETFVAEPRDKDGDVNSWRWPVPVDPALVTGMRSEEFSEIYCRVDPYERNSTIAAQAIANAALRHAVDAGQLVKPQKSSICIGSHWLYGTEAATAEASARLSERPEAERNAQRDILIAVAVRNACFYAAKDAQHGNAANALHGVDLNGAIAGVTL